MALDHELRLHQEILLLTLKDERGTPAAAMYGYALAGAILTELVLEERVRLVERKSGRPVVELVSATQVGDPVLDDAIRRVRTARRRASPNAWITRWARRRVMHETARHLARRGVLRTEERRVLLLFNRTVYPAMDPGPERRLIERIRDAVLTDDAVDARTAAVVTLANAAGLLRPIFGRRALKGRKDRFELLARDNTVGAATRAAIQAAQAAMVAATAAATSAAT